MTKIIIPEFKDMNLPQRVFEIEKGDLVLVTDYERRIRKKSESIYIGVFEDIKRLGILDVLLNSKAYVLGKGSEKFGGEWIYDVHKTMGEYYLGPSLDIIVGQEQIARALQSWSGFEPHAEWVARLRKPYSREE